MRELYQVPKSQIQQIREAVDVVDLISEYIPLKKAGLNFKATCPFHKEKTPSFMVSRSKQIYHCFGCGVGGNVIDFLMKIQNIGFREALSRLAARVGIELKEYRSTKQDEERTRFFNVNSCALEFFTKTLVDSRIGKEAMVYLARRGMGRKEISDFKLGYAPLSWNGLVNFLKSKKASLADACMVGLIVKKQKQEGYYDRFRNRVMFPIFGVDGKVIGFGGRTLGEDEAKYINSPESIVFKKRASFYGLDSASRNIRETSSAIVVEGYTDLISMRRFGFVNSVATLGTAFTMDHARVLKKFTDSVYITFDSDEAGLNAVKRVLKPVLLNSLTAKVILLPSNHDPDTFLGKQGSGGFERLLSGARNLLDFYINDYFQKEVSLVGKARVLEELRGIFREIPSEFERELVIKRVSELTDIEASLFKRAEAKRYYFPSVLTGRERFPKEELLLTKFILEDANLLKLFQQKGFLEYFTSDELKRFVKNVIFDVERNGDVSVNDLIDEINDQELRGKLIEVLVSEASFNPEETRKAFENCVERIKGNYLKRRSMELQDELMRAEKNGDEARCRELLEEKKTLIEGKLRRW